MGTFCFSGLAWRFPDVRMSNEGLLRSHIAQARSNCPALFFFSVPCNRRGVARLSFIAHIERRLYRGGSTSTKDSLAARRTSLDSRSGGRCQTPFLDPKEKAT